MLKYWGLIEASRWYCECSRIQVGQRGIKQVSTSNHTYSIYKSWWWPMQSDTDMQSFCFTFVKVINDYFQIRFQKIKDLLLNIIGLEFVVFIRFTPVFCLWLLPFWIAGRNDFFEFGTSRPESLPLDQACAFLSCSLTSFCCSRNSLLNFNSALIFSRLDSFSRQQVLSFLRQSTSSGFLVCSSLMCSISIYMLFWYWLFFLGVTCAAFADIKFTIFSISGNSNKLLLSILLTIEDNCLSLVALSTLFYEFSDISWTRVK